MSTVNYSTTITEDLAPCPLCGRRLEMKVQGKLFTETPEYELPVYMTRYTIKCPTEFLTLDLEYDGHVDVRENEQVEDLMKKLRVIMRDRANAVRGIWNRRVV